MRLTTPKDVINNVTEKESKVILGLIEEGFKKNIEIYNDGTPQKHVDIIIKNEYSIEARKEVAAKYVAMGWREVVLKGSSEGDERGGLTSVKLYFIN